MTGNHGEIDGATRGNVADGAWIAGLGEAKQDFNAGGVAEGFEEVGFDATAHAFTALLALDCGFEIVAVRVTIIVYLRHSASIATFA